MFQWRRIFAETLSLTDSAHMVVDESCTTLKSYVRACHYKKSKDMLLFEKCVSHTLIKNIRQYMVKQYNTSYDLILLAIMIIEQSLNHLKSK